MRDRKNRRVATATRLRLKRRKQKRYSRIQVGLGIVFSLCIGILLLLFIRQRCDDAEITDNTMCGYDITKFYDMDQIDNSMDLNVQINTIRWLNQMIDEKILSIS